MNISGRKQTLFHLQLLQSEQFRKGSVSFLALFCCVSCCDWLLWCNVILYFFHTFSMRFLLIQQQNLIEKYGSYFQNWQSTRIHFGLRMKRKFVWIAWIVSFKQPTMMEPTKKAIDISNIWLEGATINKSIMQASYNFNFINGCSRSLFVNILLLNKFWRYVMQIKQSRHALCMKININQLQVQK